MPKTSRHPGFTKRSGRWYFTAVTPDGGRRRIATGCRDIEDAKRRAREIQRSALDPRNEEALTIETADAFERFVEDRRVDGCAEATLRYYAEKLSAVASRFPKYLRDVDAVAFRKYAEARLGDGTSRATVKKELKAATSVADHRGSRQNDEPA